MRFSNPPAKIGNRRERERERVEETGGARAFVYLSCRRSNGKKKEEKREEGEERERDGGKKRKGFAFVVERSERELTEEKKNEVEFDD